MENNAEQPELSEQELADKIQALVKERFLLEERRGNGITLEKNEFIGDRYGDIEAELSQLKSLVQEQLKTPKQ